MDRRLSSLAVPSETKAKAIEEARKTQASVLRECAAANRDPPPYVLSELIGKGSFGRVFKATIAKTDQVVAVKIISIEEGDVGGGVSSNAAPASAGPAGGTGFGSTAQQKTAAGAVDTFGDILKEISTLKLLGASGARNINVVLDSLLVGPSVWMVMEYCAGGSVATLMRPTGYLPEKWIVPILREVAEAIFWVHRQGIIHRDIKCANVLVTEAGGIQLCDFGVAGIIESTFDKRRTVTGTLHWMAPELFNVGVSYGTEVDIWAFGSMAYEVASGLPPNATMAIDLSEFGSYLEQNCPRLVGSQYSTALKDIVAFCMVHDRKQRPSIEEVQRHPYIANTTKTHPTESLLTLLSAYRLWQSRGGGRLSLFSAGGARGVSDTEPKIRVPDWDFSDGNDDDNDDDDDDDDDDNTTNGSFALDYEANTLAVYEAYGISFDDSPAPTPSLPEAPLPPPQSRRRRRQPPSIKPLPVPLEKVFNPNTLTNYQDNARAVYGRHPVNLSPPISDLPLRDYGERTPVRESLIDLDLSVAVDRPDNVAGPDDDTIRPRHQPSGPTDLMRHRTQDWTFPAPKSSPEAANNAEPPWKNQPSAFPPSDQNSNKYQKKRASTVSLIDLDASFIDSSQPPRRPSTAYSEDTGAGSDNDDTPFEFDMIRPTARHSHEPSIYVSDSAVGAYVSGTSEAQNGQKQAGDFQRLDRWFDDSPRSLPPLPPMPLPPSTNVLQGLAGRDDAKNELLRILSSLGEHLQIATQTLEGLPVRTMRRNNVSS